MILTFFGCCLEAIMALDAQLHGKVLELLMQHDTDINLPEHTGN